MASPRAQPLLLEIAADRPDEVLAVIVQKTVDDARVEEMATRLGGTVTRDLHIINAFAAKLPGRAVAELARTDGVRWVSLDAPVVEAGRAHEEGGIALRADFDSPTYHDERSGWSRAWVEIGEEDGPELGDVAIASFLGGTRQGLRIQGANKGLQSAVDLSRADSAELSIAYRRKGFDASDYVVVEASADGGSTWAELDRLAGPATDPDVLLSHYDLTPFVSGDVDIRFVSSASWDSQARFYIDYVQVTYTGGLPDESADSLQDVMWLPYKVMLPLVTTPGASAGDDGLSFHTAAATGGSQTVRDEFNTVSFGNNDGSVNWSGNWVEIGENDGPYYNDVSVASYLFNDQALRISDNNKGARRAADLSGAASAVLSFEYARRGLDSTYDYVALEISTNGGASWTELDRFKGPAHDPDGVAYNASYDISGYASGQTVIRFMSSPYLGSQDRVYFDDVQIAYSRVVKTVRDEFNTASYANDDGSAHWAGSWGESDPSGGGATGGYVRVDGGRLRFHHAYAGYENVARQVNLAGYAKATLTFDWQTYGLDWGETMSVLVSKDGVAPFVELDAFGGSHSGSATYDISAYISDRTTIRFENLSQDWEYGEYAFFDNIQIEASGLCATCVDTSNLANAYVEAIGADRLWNTQPYLQGQGVTVAVVDSGIALHDDLLDASGNSRIVAQVDFSSASTLPDDFYGHGTHIAGIIGGDGARSGGAFPGIAPGVNLIDVKVTDDWGAGTTSGVIAGLQWVYDNKDVYNIRVVNMSLNSTVAEHYNDSPLNAAVEILWFNSIVVVVSGGNNGDGPNEGILYPPANDPFVISVGATDDRGTPDVDDDVLALFSAHGQSQGGFDKPDLIVPGKDIISLLAGDDSNLALGHPDHAVAGPDGIYYFRMSGTSMASAVAAGAAALLLQDEPNLTPDQVKYRLMATARPFASPSPGPTTVGYLDIYAAVRGTTTQSANTGIKASQLLWSGSDPITWGSVNWNSVNWNSVNWNSVNWNSVNWNSVNWNSVHWGP